MANTFPKQPLRLRSMNDPLLQYAVRRHYEGATQTFVAHAPVVMTGGYIVEAASPATDIFGFAVRAGQNLAAGAAMSEFIPVIDGLEFNANFLGGSAADNVIAIADFGGSYDLIKSATLLGASRPGWYVADAAASASVKMVRAETDYRHAAELDSHVVHVGDTNARPTFVVLDSVRSYD